MNSPASVEAALRGLVMGCWLCEQHKAGLPLDSLTKLSPDGVWKERFDELRDLVLTTSGGLEKSVHHVERLKNYLDDHGRSAWLPGASGAFLVDLYILALLTSEGAGEQWDESAWDRFENACAGLGTDLLHLLHYVDECREEGVEPSMDDFVESFVISPELEDQEHLMAYEEVLASRDLIQEPLRDMLAECRALAPDSAIESVFTGLFVYLRQESTDVEWLSSVWLPSEDLSDFLPLLACVQAYQTQPPSSRSVRLMDWNLNWLTL
jgi:hypothetical protein